MACDYETEFRCGDGEHNLLKKILGRLAQLVGLAGGGGGVGDTVTLTVSDIEIGAVEIKDGDTDARAKVITACPDPADRGLVVRNIPCGTQAISAASLPLPTGAMTEASFLARTNTLGQKNMSGSMPVVLAADQSPIPFTIVGASFIGVCPGEFDQGLIVRNIPCGTQAVSGPLTNAELRATPVPVSGTVTTGGLTDAQLRATPVPVTFGTFMTTCPVGTESGLIVRAVPCGTQAISAASLPLPTGAATESTTLSTYFTLADISAFIQVFLPNLDVPLSELNNKFGTLGQKTMAGSAPVVIASNQSAIPVSGIVSTKTALTASSPTATSVGVASASAVASNANRKGLILTNTAVTARISLGIGAAAVLDSGITLYPGDSWSMDEYSFSTAVINAIASAAASNLAIQEFTT